MDTICEQLKSEILNYAYNFDSVSRHKVIGHLSQCESCQATYDEARKEGDAIHAKGNGHGVI